MFTTLLKLANSLVNIKINAQIREGVYCGFSVASKGNIIQFVTHVTCKTLHLLMGTQRHQRVVGK